eukprot:TRINITY_DN8216_c0_g3_i1.p1 TRINITY_DN8216_c0_g3~~TRINITY_DN8216_c0_g3_i1.p1  ORF type:complete len:515 (+),score=123.92 TRINITY_DN8216_c0_g3_i1:233-1546(+)
MAYLRLGSAGKAPKKKKKGKDNRVLAVGLTLANDEENAALEAHEDGRRDSRSAAEHESNGGAMAPSSLSHPDAAAPMGAARNDEDDIFVGAGVDYLAETHARLEEESKARGTSEEMPPPPPPPRTRGERGGGVKGVGAGSKYFDQPSELLEAEAPLPVQTLGATLGDWQGAALPPANGWSEYPPGLAPEPPSGPEGGFFPQLPTDADPYVGAYPPPPPDYAHPIGAANWYGDQGHMAAYPEPPPMPPPPPPPNDPYPMPPPPGDPGLSNAVFMSQEEKDRGLGSVFRRDDQRLVGQKENDPRERDPAFVSASYSECYPDYQGFTREVVESDEEEDLSKMDQGSKAKGRLHEWDFESEEAWTDYNQSKEAMPKAAYQYGVKTADGRKTKKSAKDREKKLTDELHQINKIWDRSRKEREGGGGVEEDEDGPQVKRSRGL